ncbi:hypothetical protein Tco_1251111, partial [Tanacetum coccineum]
AGENRFLQINELDEISLNAYETSISYKERAKRWHDKRIQAPTSYDKGDKVLLCNSRLRLFPGKLKSRWYGPFSVCKDMKNGAIKLYNEDGNGFIVNKQRVKPYQKSVLNTKKDDDITLDDEEEVTLGHVTSNSSLRFDQDSSLRFVQDSSLHFDQDSSLRFDQDSSLRFDQDSSLRFDQDTSLRFDQDSSLSFDQDSSLHFDSRFFIAF